MTIRAPRAGYLAEIAFGNLVLEEKVHRVRAHEIAGREEQIRLLNCVRHRVALLRGDAQWLFCEHVFSCFCRRQHKIVVPIGLRTNHHGRDVGIRPDFVHVIHHLGAQFLRPFLRARNIVVPDRLHLHVLAFLQQINKAGCVNVGAADESHRDCLVGRYSRWQAGGKSGDTGAADEVATSQVRIHDRQYKAAVCQKNCLRGLIREADVINSAARWQGRIFNTSATATENPQG